MVLVGSVCFGLGAVVAWIVYAVVRANRELDVMAGEE
jgi:hypothetical protein